MTKGGTYASPPCIGAQVDPANFDPLGVDPGQARGVARLRRVERTRLPGLREGLGQAGRAQVSARIVGHLGRALTERGVRRGCVLSGYWPIKGKPELRPALADLHRAGVAIALPLVEARAAPLTFRRWSPETRLVRGDWNIPVPPPTADVLAPDIALAPFLGWDGACYRLGRSGGYFDRSLAALVPRPLTISIALGAARLPTIFPQPRDAVLDLILTEDGVAAERPESRTDR